MKLAVRKEEGIIPGSGFHYSLHPFPMKDDFEAVVFEKMGYHIIELGDEDGKRLCSEAGKALMHQIEVAVLVEERKKNDAPSSQHRA